MSIVSPPDPDDRVCQLTLRAVNDEYHARINDSLVIASPQSRNMIADWLERRAEQEATGSRDFGRGFMHAVRVIREG